MGKFLTLAYWLDMRPEGLHYSLSAIFLSIVVACIVLIVLFRIAKKKKNNLYFKIWRSLNTFAITNIILAAFLWFFAYEGVYIFSSRLWVLIWILSMPIWLFFILKDLKKIPEIKKEHEKLMEYKKYIP